MLSSFLLTANHSCILPHACTHSCCRVGKDPPQRSSGTCQNDRISLAISRLQDDGGGTKNRHYKTAEYQDLFKELYLYLYIRPNLSCTLICDLIAVGSYDAQKIKYINVLTLAHAFFFLFFLFKVHTVSFAVHLCKVTFTVLLFLQLKPLNASFADCI